MIEIDIFRKLLKKDKEVKQVKQLTEEDKIYKQIREINIMTCYLNPCVKIDEGVYILTAMKELEIFSTSKKDYEELTVYSNQNELFLITAANENTICVGGRVCIDSKLSAEEIFNILKIIHEELTLKYENKIKEKECKLEEKINLANDLKSLYK